MSRHRAVRGNWQDEIEDDGYDWEIKHVSKAVPGADVDWIVETLDYYNGDTEATIEYLQQEIGSTVSGKKHFDFVWENDVLIVECDSTVLPAAVPIHMVTTPNQALQSLSDRTEKKIDLMQLAGGAVGKRKFGDLLSKNPKSMIKEGNNSLLRNKMDDVVWSNNSSLSVGKPSAFAALVTTMEKDNIADKLRNQLKI